MKTNHKQQVRYLYIVSITGMICTVIAWIVLTIFYAMDNLYTTSSSGFPIILGMYEQPFYYSVFRMTVLLEQVFLVFIFMYIKDVFNRKR